MPTTHDQTTTDTCPARIRWSDLPPVNTGDAIRIRRVARRTITAEAVGADPQMIDDAVETPRVYGSRGQQKRRKSWLETIAGWVASYAEDGPYSYVPAPDGGQSRTARMRQLREYISANLDAVPLED